MAIPRDKLGAYGVYGELLIVPFMKGETDDDAEIKKARVDLRPFEAKALLSKSAGETNLKGSFEASDGDSFVIAEAKAAHIEVGTPIGVLRLDINDAREISMVSATIEANTAKAALAQFKEMLDPFLDYLAYSARVPIRVSITVVRDVETEVITFGFVAPPLHSVIRTSDFVIHPELTAVYALYREAQNSDSPYYRVICLAKIMEGLLGSMRANLRKQLRKANVAMDEPKLLVPAHDEVAMLSAYFGKSIKEFADKFLQKEFRDAMAHFSLKERAPVNVSNHPDWLRFTSVAFLADMCVRVLIASHEAALGKLAAATREEGSAVEPGSAILKQKMV